MTTKSSIEFFDVVLFLLVKSHVFINAKLHQQNIYPPTPYFFIFFPIKTQPIKLFLSFPYFFTHIYIYIFF
ncbi:hypothetical protein BDF21DRAFT_431647 [Thamnidium elegans]|nr:hypothetical protein BDF21DRAFT_431647 [Thamnidium elegans]